MYNIFKLKILVTTSEGILGSLQFHSECTYQRPQTATKVRLIRGHAAYIEESCVQEVSRAHRQGSAKIKPFSSSVLADYFYCLPICGDTPLIRGDQYMHFGLCADRAVEIYHEMGMRALGKENLSFQIALDSEARVSQPHLPVQHTNLYLFIPMELPHTRFEVLPPAFSPVRLLKYVAHVL